MRSAMPEDSKRTCVQVHVSWAPTDDEAVAIAHDQWRTNVFGSELAWNLELPSQFDAAATTVRAEDVREVVLVSSDLERHAAWLQEIAELGVDEISSTTWARSRARSSMRSASACSPR